MAFYDIDLEKKIESNHELRKINECINFSSVAYRVNSGKSEVGRHGYGLDCGLKCLFLQFMFDHSDREMEKQLRYNLAYQWFCGFTAFEQTPDHSFFSRFRKQIGTKQVAKVFQVIVDKAKDRNLIRAVFHFVDATNIVTKNTTWAERDTAIQAGEDGLNNRTVKQYSSDKQARFGCKGKRKFWFGYKGHIGVDMSSGLIEKAAVTPANVSDQDGFKSICPRDGQLVFGDKAYCLKAATDEMARRGVTCGAILRQNMKRKNKDLDRWRSSVRAPFEGVFSKFEKRARYRGHAKFQFQFFMDAIVHNIKRLVAIHAPPLFQGA